MKRFNFVKLAENKYNRLLSVLILGLLFYPFIDISWIGGSVLILSFFFVCLVTILLVIKELEHRRWLFRHYIQLAAFFFLLRAISQLFILPFGLSRLLSSASAAVFLYFLGLSIYLILNEIFPAGTVRGDTIKGGICVYLLIGFFWATVYDVLSSFDPLAFRSLSGLEKQANLIYFSFTTLTTTGYGDIAPISAIARAFANLEAIMGVLYPAIFIARLVGLYSSQQNKD
jgi:hypothetical protein